MRILVALLLGVMACGRAEAQPAFDRLDVGSRVRVSILVPDSTGFHSSDRVVGSLLSYGASTIQVDPGPIVIPWAAVAKLELSTGRHGNAGRGARYGALIGLVAGVVVGVTQGRKEGGGEGNEDLAEEGGVVLGLGGLLAGLGIGALIGGRLKSEDWHDIPLAKH